MAATRYTVLFANRNTGVVRRLTLRLRLAATGALLVLVTPILIGLGARWSALAEVDVLRAERARLEMENASYRAATGELTTQIASLQEAITELGRRTALDPASAHAVERLPAIVKSSAMGGAIEHTPPSTAWVSSAVLTPESTFGLLRDLLGSLESRLRLVRGDVERREALAAATPSIWPAHGWLSAAYGQRLDPFTGARDFHPALDISTEKGRPVYATAAGTIESAGYAGAYGNLVVVRHNFGLTTRYGHLSRFAVKPGDVVQRGDVIGHVGATGRATGAHLHYEVMLNGTPINPLRLLTAPAARP